jgi:two-component system chemotaxis response regulator CheB
MVVDDSAVIRGLITKALEADADLKVIMGVGDGNMAVYWAKHEQPDVVILDIEMPVMDGITALPKVLEASPKTKVIIASTLSQRNATISLEALSLGASDYLPKPSARDPEELKSFHRELLMKVRALGGLPPVSNPKTSAPATAMQTPAATSVPRAPHTGPIKLLPETSTVVQALAIASSTGGPQALLTLLTALNGKLMHIPIFITQHMPATFTALLAEQIGKASGRPSAEAKEGEAVQPGHIYVAPGNYHMTVARSGTNFLLHLDQGPLVNFCRPAADPMLESLSKVYGASLFTVVLTGMGADGAEGCVKVAEKGGSVIAQDEASCVVYGMPKAAAEAGVCQAILPLSEIAAYLIKRC